MPALWIDALVVLAGTLHAAAAWFYFSRERMGLAWPAAWLLMTAATLVGARSDPALAYGLFTAMIGLWTAWWVTIRPKAKADWVAENRFQASGHINGDTLTLDNVRAFRWRTRRNFDEVWEKRSYDLSKLSALDLFICTWGDPRIAHIIMSFVFDDGPPLAVSIETRREQGERWTALAGFMKSYEIIFIAQDERDAIRNRCVVRDEHVRLYRLYSTMEMRQKLIRKYAADMRRLAMRPRFYNTVFTNCTTEVGRLVRLAGHPYPLDWRILVSGRVPEFLYDQKLLDTTRPFAELHAAALINAKARAAPDDATFSRSIRVGLSDPNTTAAAVSQA